MPTKSFLPAKSFVKAFSLITLSAVALGVGWFVRVNAQANTDPPAAATTNTFDDRIRAQAIAAFRDGRNTFRFDTYGDEDFWGGKLLLHRAIEGAALGGVGAGISPATALKLGLKVDVDALSPAVLKGLQTRQININDPATTLALLKVNAVVGLKGFFTGNRLDSVGITCALCHSTVDNSLTFGVGHRLDGWANRDLEVGNIIAAAPDLTPFTTLLGVNRPALDAVLLSWGPGKFDAEIFLDGKTFNTQQMTDGS